MSGAFGLVSVLIPLCTSAHSLTGTFDNESMRRWRGDDGSRAGPGHEDASTGRIRKQVDWARLQSTIQLLLPLHRPLPQVVMPAE